LLDLGYSKKMF